MMNSELLIKNGRVVDPANCIDKKCDVLIVDGNIAEVGELTQNLKLETQNYGTVIDAAGKLVTPGLTAFLASLSGLPTSVLGYVVVVVSKPTSWSTVAAP